MGDVRLFWCRRNFIATKVAGERLPEVPHSAIISEVDRHRTSRSQVYRCILLGRCTFGRFPTAYTAPPWQVDLTSRFLQFGVLENQCGQSYLAVPIASRQRHSSVSFSLHSSPRSLRLRNRKTRSDERKSTVLHHA